jgi:hypothetical protein
MAALDLFSPRTREWFERTFDKPTPAQELGWPKIASGAHTLIQAPTGSGKTLAAFLFGLDRLIAEPGEGTRLVYVSPLKALNYDIERNLRGPLAGLQADVKVAVRTGDTSQKERAAMLRHPPDLLITTPESLFLMLTSRARETLGTGESDSHGGLHARTARPLRPKGRGGRLAVPPFFPGCSLPGLVRPRTDAPRTRRWPRLRYRCLSAGAYLAERPFIARAHGSIRRSRHRRGSTAPGSLSVRLTGYSSRSSPCSVVPLTVGPRRAARQGRWAAASDHVHGAAEGASHNGLTAPAHPQQSHLPFRLAEAPRHDAYGQPPWPG